MTWPSCRANNRLHSVPVPVPVRLLSTNKTWQNARLWHHIVSAYFLYWLTVRELNKRDLALLFPRSVSLFNKELSLPLSTLLQGDRGRGTAVSAVLVFVFAGVTVAAGAGSGHALSLNYDYGSQPNEGGRLDD